MANVIRGLVAVTAAIGVPLMSILAYVAWTRRLRAELAVWRNVLGIASIAATLFSWLTFFAPFLYKAIGLRTHPFSSAWDAATLYAAILGTFLAFFLRDDARVRAVLAALLMGTLFYAGSIP
jgi:hypothetical protein